MKCGKHYFRKNLVRVNNIFFFLLFIVFQNYLFSHKVIYFDRITISSKSYKIILLICFPIFYAIFLCIRFYFLEIKCKYFITILFLLMKVYGIWEKMPRPVCENGIQVWAYKKTLNRCNGNKY